MSERQHANTGLTPACGSSLSNSAARALLALGPGLDAVGVRLDDSGMMFRLNQPETHMDDADRENLCDA